jgi:hypothetical protein
MAEPWVVTGGDRADHSEARNCQNLQKSRLRTAYATLQRRSERILMIIVGFWFSVKIAFPKPFQFIKLWPSH